ncbi:Beta-1,2-xylosyltransferase [Camellia lanceoleosa]|uniref:Beta-1,2-xylosyltransferase n=1 Tax=Camellia lanceoleosa TaxID=1840588 RepID=A0ACC0G937_9ERIC|nr:Beta-1,2-xylosyltransferase [Camellia lanceoleosa]
MMAVEIFSLSTQSLSISTSPSTPHTPLSENHKSLTGNRHTLTENHHDFSISKPWPILLSYLPWFLNPNVSFRSYKSYFGNGFTLQIDLLKLSFSDHQSLVVRCNSRPTTLPHSPLRSASPWKI